MNVLVFLENRGDALAKGSLGLLAKAATLAGDDGEVGAVLAGSPGIKGLVAEAGAFGARRVYLAEDESLEPPLPQPRVDLLEEVVRSNGYDTVLFANSVMAADIAAGLAVRLGAGLNWDLIDVVVREGQLVGKQLALGESVLADLGWRSPIRLALFRTGAFEPTLVGPDQADPQVSEVPLRLLPHSTAARVVEQHLTSDAGPALEDAEVVVAGGMGLGSAEHFKLAEDLASALGGVVGATRAAVYAGWYPHSAQVGQTGKTVTPKLYVALGISGAVQHKVGMQSSKVVVAVNKDPNAAIFEYSDLAVIGDLHTIVPQVVELLERRASS
jgi:electron transfer flavoprotein alpha subunit